MLSPLSLWKWRAVLTVSLESVLLGTTVRGDDLVGFLQNPPIPLEMRFSLENGSSGGKQYYDTILESNAIVVTRSPSLQWLVTPKFYSKRAVAGIANGLYWELENDIIVVQRDLQQGTEKTEGRVIKQVRPLMYAANAALNFGLFSCQPGVVHWKERDFNVTGLDGPIRGHARIGTNGLIVGLDLVATVAASEHQSTVAYGARSNFSGLLLPLEWDIVPATPAKAQRAARFEMLSVNLFTNQGDMVPVIDFQKALGPDVIGFLFVTNGQAIFEKYTDYQIPSKRVAFILLSSKHMPRQQNLWVVSGSGSRPNV